MFQIAAPAKSVKPLNGSDEMAYLNCKVGDLAVIVEAHNQENLGTFVVVLRPHQNQSAIVKPENDLLWLVKSTKPMIYERGQRYIKRTKGAAPDSCLRPIRGLPPDIAVEAIKICKEPIQRPSAPAN